MLVLKIADVDPCKQLSVKKVQDNKYLQFGSAKAVLQTPWITLDKYCLPSKQYVKDTDSSISLTVPFDYNSQMFSCFWNVDNKLIPDKLHNDHDGKLHELVKEKGGPCFVKFKLYKDTTLLIEKIESKVSNVYGWYDILEEGVQVRMLFGFTKLWNLNGSFGFSVRVNKIQVKLGESVKKPVVREEFTDD
jgi:hypothetical protein